MDAHPTSEASESASTWEELGAKMVVIPRSERYQHPGSNCSTSRSSAHHVLIQAET